MAAAGEECYGAAEAGRNRPLEGEESDGSVIFSDAETQSWRSTYPSHRTGSSCDELRISNLLEADDDPVAGGLSGRNSCDSDCSVEIRPDDGVQDVKISIPKVERDCRICHLDLVSGAPESGIPIELGCSCKEDLASAHRQCAEAWFQIRGNRICEVCGAVAKNVKATGETEFIEQVNETGCATPAANATENQSSWHGHRFLNLLLACLVFALVVSWLLHFNVPG